jgi:hypothetical protein
MYRECTTVLLHCSLSLAFAAVSVVNESNQLCVVGIMDSISLTWLHPSNLPPCNVCPCLLLLPLLLLSCAIVCHYTHVYLAIQQTHLPGQYQ